MAFFSSSTYPDTFIISILSFKAPGMVSVTLAVHINNTCEENTLAAFTLLKKIRFNTERRVTEYYFPQFKIT